MATPHNIYSEVENMLREYIKANNLRLTQERLLILQQICSYEGLSFSPEKLYNDLKEKLPLSLATIYNSIDLFQQAKIIIPLFRQDGERTNWYELTLYQHGNMMFTCTRCGRQGSFKDATIEKVLRNKKIQNFNALSFSVHLFGECKACRKPSKNN
ncbi:MAG: transcriptional repressor [Paludibacteraceae bacterium]|nr:transcriptional repressor [Paludibacteraceae bacterium]